MVAQSGSCGVEDARTVFFASEECQSQQVDSRDRLTTHWLAQMESFRFCRYKYLNVALNDGSE